MRIGFRSGPERGQEEGAYSSGGAHDDSYRYQGEPVCGVVCGRAAMSAEWSRLGDMRSARVNERVFESWSHEKKSETTTVRETVTVTLYFLALTTIFIVVAHRAVARALAELARRSSGPPSGRRSARATVPSPSHTLASPEFPEWYELLVRKSRASRCR